MRKLFKSVTLSVLAFGLLTSTASAEDKEVNTNYEEKLPYMFKDPNWEKYKHGDQGPWPLPPAPNYSTGLYSMAANNSIDYKEDSNSFYEQAAKYKHTGNVEVYYKSNPSTSVNMGIPSGGTLGRSVGGDTTLEFTFSDSKVPAFNNIKGNNELILDSSQGQWLVTNGFYSRDNLGQGIRRLGGQGSMYLSASPLEPSPWGVMGASVFITPEDFLMGLAKSVYGVQESRPIYMQTTPHRLAKKVTWSVTNYCPGIVWTYQTDDWTVKDVSYINPAWADLSPPSCGQTKIMDRGEYIVHPEGYLNNVWYRYRNDQNSYVSPNVYEIYFAKLLEKGIISTDNAFANMSASSMFTPDPKNKATSFSFTNQFANRFFSEYQDYALADSSSKYKYPVWAPELGALYTNPEFRAMALGSNTTDKNITLTTSGGSNYYQKALGQNYNLTGDSVNGVTSITVGDAQGKIMAKNTIKLIDALQVIERAMRVEDGDMSHTEAAIVSKKYGAQYLDNLSEEDRQTVSYLLAKGVLNFENYQEYSNLYSPLSQSFAYKLIYRVANKEARMSFSEIVLTDSGDLPANFREYKQSIVKADLSKLSQVGSLTEDGKLIKNKDGEKLTLLADINFKTRTQELPGSADGKVGTRYRIFAEIDDPLKYLYRSMPLINVTAEGEPMKNSNGEGFHVYVSNSKKIYNNISTLDKRYVGIESVKYNNNTNRYDIVFLAYGDSYDTALKFVKANLQTRIANVSNIESESSVISESKVAMSEVKGSELNSALTTNNDIVVNKDYGLTSYSNDKTSIVGNTLVSGPTAIKVGDNTMTSLNIVSKLSNTTGFDKIGSKELVSVDAGQLKQLATPVQNPQGKQVGSTNMLQEKVSSKPSTKGKGDIEKDITAYSLSMLKSTDTLVVDKVFTYKVYDEAKKKEEVREITGSVIVSWNLDLPSDLEQDSLVGAELTSYINDGAKSSWMFTKPKNKSLLNVWEYNVGLNEAILKALSGSDITVPSGYFTPAIDILVDSLNVKEIDETGKSSTYDISDKQLKEIEAQLISEIGKNLETDWINKYIGSVALANHIAKESTKGNKDIENYLDKKKETKDSIYVKPSGMLRELKVPAGKTVWSELVFGQTKPKEHSSDYFDMHTHLAELNTHTIYSVKEGNSFYGYYFSGEGEGINPDLNIYYVKDNFDNIYKEARNSGYRYDKDANVLYEESSTYEGRLEGKVIKYKDEEWVVAEETPYTYNLYSKKFLTAIMKDGKLYQSTSGAMDAPNILDAIHSVNIKTFGSGQEEGINSKEFMRTHSFDFTPSPSIVAPDTKFTLIKNGVMIPHIYKNTINVDGKTSLILEKTTVNNEEVVNVPAFVTLSKATWSINNGLLEWNKKFMGADQDLYTKGQLVQSLKEQILTKDSKNIVLSEEVKTGTLIIGDAVGTITGKNVTFIVPFNSTMISGKSLNQEEVLNTFNNNSDITIVGDGQVASAAQYLKDKQVGKYDPNFKNYHNTLVDNNGRLQVATGTKLIDYTDSTVVDSVSLTAIVMDGVRFLNNGANSSLGIYKIYQYQTVKPPAIVSPFTTGAPPILNADNAIIADVATPFEGIPTALELFDSLQSHLKKMWAENTWLLIVTVVLGSSVLLSITTLLAHVFAHSPISNLFFERIMDVTGVDVISLMSVGSVRITGEPPNRWVRTLITSLFLGVVPIVIFGVMMVYGLV